VEDKSRRSKGSSERYLDVNERSLNGTQVHSVRNAPQPRNKTFHNDSPRLTAVSSEMLEDIADSTLSRRCVPLVGSSG